MHYFFFNSLKKIGVFFILSPQYSLLLYHIGSLFIIKKGHYSLIIIPHPDPPYSHFFNLSFSLCVLNGYETIRVSDDLMGHL